MLQVTPKFILRYDRGTFSSNRKNSFFYSIWVGIYSSFLSFFKFWCCFTRSTKSKACGKLCRMHQAFSTGVSFPLPSPLIGSKKIYWGISSYFWDKTIDPSSFLLNTSLTWRETILIHQEMLWELLSFYGVHLDSAIFISSGEQSLMYRCKAIYKVTQEIWFTARAADLNHFLFLILKAPS